MTGRVLDRQSRQTLTEFAAQTTIGLVLIVVLWLVKPQSNLELGHATVRVFQFYSMIDCCRALRRRDVFGGPSLNLWDLSLVYSAIAFLLHGIMP